MDRMRTEGRGTHGGLMPGVVLAVAMGAAAMTLSPPPPERDDPVPSTAAQGDPDPWPAQEDDPVLEDDPALSAPELGDPRAHAFFLAYRALIDSVTHRRNDVVFHLGRGPIHFQNGRFLKAGRVDGRADCDPIFYRYSLEPLAEPPPAPDELPTYCSDVLETLWGRTEGQIREHGRSTTFLDHRMFVNERLIGPLAAVERDIVNAATRDAAVAAWIDELDVTYSFINREIAGSATRSRHAWGLAIDLVPRSYDGRHVYWRWSRALEGGDWDRIPMERRWSPPRRVVAIFERHGFVWGGKWPLFDAIHFEYRPEILLYNRMISAAGG